MRFGSSDEYVTGNPNRIIKEFKPLLHSQMNQKPVFTFAKWQVKKGQLDAVLTLLAEATRKSTLEEGNLFYKVYQSNTDPDTLLLYEGYVNNDAVDAHRSSAHFQTIVIGQIIPLLENREVMLASELDLLNEAVR